MAKSLFLIKLQLQAEGTASDLSCIFFLKIYCLFHFNRKMKWKKGNTPMEFKYLLFCLSINLLDVKRNLTDGNSIRKCVQREFDVALFMVRGISLGKSFWVVNIWWAPVWKRLNGSALNFAHIFSADCCTKPCLCFC